jgi:hypothetical protein
LGIKIQGNAKAFLKTAQKDRFQKKESHCLAEVISGNSFVLGRTPPIPHRSETSQLVLSSVSWQFLPAMWLFLGIIKDIDEFLFGVVVYRRT